MACHFSSFNVACFKTCNFTANSNHQISTNDQSLKISSFSRWCPNVVLFVIKSSLPFSIIRTYYEEKNLVTWAPLPRLFSGDRPFQCEVCPKSFARAQQRKIHMVVHTGERAFLCSECGASFGSVSTLIDHRKRKHLLVRNKNIVTTCMNQLNNLLIQCFWSDSFSKWLRENNIFAEIGDYAKILFSHSKPNQSYCAKIIFSQSNFHGCQVVASRRKAKWDLQNVRGWK